MSENILNDGMSDNLIGGRVCGGVSTDAPVRTPFTSLVGYARIPTAEQNLKASGNLALNVGS